MVEVKTVKIKNQHVIGIHLCLPGNPIYFLVTTHMIIAGKYFHTEAFKHSKVLFVKVEDSSSFSSILNSKVSDMNIIAMDLGIEIGMNMEEVLEHEEIF